MSGPNLAKMSSAVMYIRRWITVELQWPKIDVQQSHMGQTQVEYMCLLNKWDITKGHWVAGGGKFEVISFESKQPHDW